MISQPGIWKSGTWLIGINKTTMSFNSTPPKSKKWYETIPLIALFMQLRQRLKIGPKLVIGFGILILLMVGGFGLGIFASINATKEIDITTKYRAPFTLAASHAQTNWLKLDSYMQGYLAFGTQFYQIRHENTRKDFENSLVEMEVLLNQVSNKDTADYRETSRTLDDLRYYYGEWIKLTPQLFELREDQLKREPALNILIIDSAPHINGIITNATSMINTQKQLPSTPENVKILSAMYDFQSSFYAMIAGLRGYVTTTRPGFKFEYQANLDINTQTWKSIQAQSINLTPSQVDSLEKIDAERKAFIPQVEKMFRTVEGEFSRADLRLYKTEAAALSDRIIYLLDQENTRQQKLLQAELNSGRQELLNAQRVSIAGAVIVILAGLILAFAISKDIAGPIVQLTKTAEKVKSGDLTARIASNSSDEIGILTETFNSMTANLQGTLESLKAEQEKSENLLLNILPKDIAELLKKEPHTIAEEYNEASILFADVVNFTPMSSQMKAIELVELLNKVFSQFDDLVEKYDLEKIKTIGDCYMVASGVPNAREDHAKAITQLGLEMQEIVKQSDYFGRKLNFRIGINSGPVVAGVIGRKKFIYDLWGDAVNTASRMESNGAGGLVQITQDTYELIKNDFNCESRGTINVKGKGDLAVWFVHGKKIS